MNFELISDYQPTGDQPEAIAQLTEGIRQHVPAQTLLGVTGSGKTFTIANVIKNINKPTLILSHNKTLAAQLYGEFKNFFLTTQWNITCLTTTIISRKHTFRRPILILKKTWPSTRKSTSFVWLRLLPSFPAGKMSSWYRPYRVSTVWETQQISITT